MTLRTPQATAPSRKRCGGGRRARRGSNAIEFALILPVLIAVLLAIAEWGWYFNQQIGVQTAVREGTRAGAVCAQEDDPPTVAEARARAALAELGLDATTATISVTTSGTSPDELLTVELAVPYEALTGFVPAPGVLGGSLTMRLEDQAD